ncbi:hypothetical protein AB0F92_21200 [Kitasatospora aureofaciens]|uniref:hypothetical protein n=1 Tax=Kitasatospora aureofaciens TaxID=1894 RepID=UPI0033EB924D
MATPGYGKQSAPEQLPRSAADFSHLPAREAYIASLIDHLPDGAAMDVKTLTVLQPHYGQMACRTVLNNLSTAGHLRRVRERISSKDCRRVFRTYFSRTPRSDAWWTQFLTTGEASEAGEASTSGAPDPPKERTLNRTSPTSAAYAALAGLGLADARLALSAADCAALEPLAAEWLARGATPALFTAALTAGLPPDGVHSPAAFTRRRLTRQDAPRTAPPGVSRHPRHRVHRLPHTLPPARPPRRPLPRLPWHPEGPTTPSASLPRRCSRTCRPGPSGNDQLIGIMNNHRPGR